MFTYSQFLQLQFLENTDNIASDHDCGMNLIAFTLHAHGITVHVSILHNSLSINSPPMKVETEY